MESKMVFYLIAKMKKRQGPKLRVYAFGLFLSLNIFFSSSLCTANRHNDYLDPVEILISSAEENPNESNSPQPNMKITEIQTVMTQTQNVFPLDFTAPFDQDLTENSLASYEKPMSDPSYELFQASISILSNDDNNSKIKSELENLIEQINNIELQSENTESGITHQTPLIQQPETQSEIEHQEKPEKSQIILTEADLSYTPITSEKLETLDKLSKESNLVDNPFEIAELLFSSNHLDKAALFYAEALNRTSSDNSIAAQRKAWILFQMANCLRKTEPNRAKQMYTQLINEFPESSWTEPAKGQVQLIDFYQTEEPEKFITDNQS
jgi:tetratricopeptide (TPR) repeat protein